MKCPKCHYLSFEPEPRCKHCGYDLSIADADLAVAPVDTTSAPLDLRLRDDVDLPAPAAAVRAAAPARASSYAGASVTMPLRSAPSAVALADPPAPRPVARAADRAVASADGRTPSRVETPRPAASTTPRTVTPAARPAPPAAPVTTELPLFVKDLAASDHVVESPIAAPGPLSKSLESASFEPAPAAAAVAAPLVAAASAPSTLTDTAELDAPLVHAEADEPIDVPIAPPPLAVRRRAPDSAPQRARVKSEPARKLGPFDRDLLEDLQRIEAEAARRAQPAPTAGDALSGVDTRRLGAAAIDAAVLGGIGVAGFWLTLRWCDLSLGQAGVLPIAPLVAFFVLIALGYLLMFTAAGGQTIGKMVLGLRVVGDLPDDETADRPSLRQACYRALLTVPSVFALGIGFVPALFGKGLAVHDRLAHTRVVRA